MTYLDPVAVERRHVVKQVCYIIVLADGQALRDVSQHGPQYQGRENFADIRTELYLSLFPCRARNLFCIQGANFVCPYSGIVLKHEVNLRAVQEEAFDAFLLFNWVSEAEMTSGIEKHGT